MFCIKCGKDNSDEAVYCQKCGAMLEAEEETRVAARNLVADPAVSGETPILTVGPTIKFVIAGYVLAVIAAIAFAAILSMMVASVHPAVPVVIGLAFLLVPAFYHIRQRLVRYKLTPSMIEIDRGIIARTTQNVPLRRIQDVTVSATMVQRLLGFGDISIDNASEDGGKVILKNIDSPRRFSDELLRQLRKTG